MKKLVLTAALAAMCAGFNAYAQQPAGAPEGGISAEMLAKISDRYEGAASDKALRNALATTSISRKEYQRGEKKNNCLLGAPARIAVSLADLLEATTLALTAESSCFLHAIS